MIILVAALILIIFLPGWWVKSVLKRYSVERDDISGTGAQLAEHLAEVFKIPVTVELADAAKRHGDHYDPSSKTIRLSEAHYDRRSLAAVVVAAHEFGHAIQHHQQYQPLEWRGHLAGLAAWMQRFGSVIMLAAPVLFLLLKLPSLGIGMLLIGLAINMSAALVHFVTLPVELDASFQRALPILEDYLAPEDVQAARKILTAAAMTYVAAALSGMLNLWYWLRLWR